MDFEVAVWNLDEFDCCSNSGNFSLFSNQQDRTVKEVIQLIEKEEKRDGGDTREEDRCMRDS